MIQFRFRFLNMYHVEIYQVEMKDELIKDEYFGQEIIEH